MIEQKTRVALLGNMNNNFFNLARYLRDLNFDAHLFIFPYDPVHFYPEADSYDMRFQGYVHKLAWGNPFDLRTTGAETIKQDVGAFDYYIACGTGAAYLAKAGIRVDLFIPYGSDIYDLPFYKIVRPTRLYDYYVFTRYQQKGIRTASHFAVADSSPVFERALSKIGFQGQRHFFAVPMVYAPQYRADVITRYYTTSKHYPAFAKIREQFDFVIFHNSRHCWKTEKDPISIKDNDKLFRGLAAFRKQYPNKKVAVVTFEYGSDVAASKELIAELGLTENVFWFPVMPRKEVMIGMSLSDLVAGEFKNSWFTYGVVFESMTLSKPMVHYRDDAMYSNFELYPMVNARTADDIFNIIRNYIDNVAGLRAIGKGANEWFERNIVQHAVRAISNLIEQKQK